MAKAKTNPAQDLVDLAKRNGADIDMSFVSDERPIVDQLAEDIERNKVKYWLRLTDGQRGKFSFFNWENGICIPVHNKFNVIQRVVCPRVFKKECQFCRRADRDQITRMQWIWEVYWHDPINKVVLFDYADNQSSPVEDLQEIAKSLAGRKRPLSMSDIEVIISQTGAQTSKRMKATIGDTEPFDFALLKGREPRTKAQLLIEYTRLVSPHLLGMDNDSDEEENHNGLPDLDDLKVFNEEE